MMQQLCEEKDGALRERDNALEHLRTVSEEKRKAESEEVHRLNTVTSTLSLASNLQVCVTHAC